MTQGSHVRLTPLEVKAAWEAGTYKPRGYLHQLYLAHKRAGWEWKIETVAKFCKKWGLAQRTFYRAKAILVKEGVFKSERGDSIVLKGTGVPKLAEDPPEEAATLPRLAEDPPEEAATLPRLAESISEKPDIKEFQESSTLLRSNSNKNNSIEKECVKKNDPRKKRIDPVKRDQADPGSTSKTKPKLRSVKTENTRTKTTNNHTRDSELEPLLQMAKELGANIKDKGLQGVISEWPDRLKRAIACLKEQQAGRGAENPTRYLHAAIFKNWEPEKKFYPGFSQWIKEARERKLAIASYEKDQKLLVLTAAERWETWETLKELSWDELEDRITSPEPEPVSEPKPEPLSEEDQRIDQTMNHLQKYKSLWSAGEVMQQMIRQKVNDHPEWGIEIHADGPHLKLGDDLKVDPQPETRETVLAQLRAVLESHQLIPERLKDLAVKWNIDIPHYWRQWQLEACQGY